MSEKTYHRQSVEIVIDRGSELYARLVDHAKREGVSVNSLVDVMVSLGASGLIERWLNREEQKNG